MKIREDQWINGSKRMERIILFPGERGKEGLVPKNLIKTS